MSERSVAELIGWVIEDNPWYTERTAYREEPKRLRANGEYWLTSKRPTVDDLLAWLMADRHLIPVIQSYVGGWYVALADDNIKPVYESPHPSGHRTLLAALEAAVRAVAGES